MSQCKNIREQIMADLGRFPPFFEPARHDAATLKYLWRQTRLSWASNAMPSHLKEAIAISASRFCSAPHRLLAYVTTTWKWQMSASALLSKLQNSPSTHEEFYADATCPETQNLPLNEWPQADSRRAAILVRCATAFFMRPGADGAATALRQALAPPLYLRVVSFIGYLRAVLSWVESFPEIASERDHSVARCIAPLVEAEADLLPYFHPPALPSCSALDIPPAMEPTKARYDADKSAEHFECARSALRLGVWSSLAPFDKVTWNRRIRELFFVQSSDVVTSDTFFGSLHKDDRERVKSLVNESLSGKIMFDAEMRAVNPEDPSEIRWIRSLAWVSYDEYNRPQRLDGVAIDLSIDKEVAQLRKARTEQFCSLLDALPTMAGLSDGRSQGCWMNKQWHAYTGLEPGRTYTLESIHPLDQDRVAKSRKDGNPKSFPVTIFYRLLGADQKYRWVREERRPHFDAEGSLRGVVASITDLEAVKQSIPDDRVDARDSRFSRSRKPLREKTLSPLTKNQEAESAC